MKGSTSRLVRQTFDAWKESFDQGIEALLQEVRPRGKLRRAFKKSDKHYGPGPHPSGTPQSIHGGERISVGITSARPSRASRQVFEEMREFESRLRSLAGVRNAVVRPGVGVWQGNREPTWVVSYQGNGEATRLLAETGKRFDQDAVLILRPCRKLRGCSVAVDFEFEGLPLAGSEKISTMLQDSGIEGWMWFKPKAGRKIVLRVAAVPQWGGSPENLQAQAQRAEAQLSLFAAYRGMSFSAISTEVMERETYDQFLQ